MSRTSSKPAAIPQQQPQPRSSRTLTRAIDTALDDKVPTPLVYIAQGDDGKPLYQAVVKLKGPTTVDVKRNLVRIQHEADPIGFLSALMNGAAVPVTVVSKDGTITTEYEQASTKDRIKIATFLANKVLPSLSIQKHVLESEQPKEDVANLSLKPGQGMTFSQMVSKAAHNGGVSQPPMIDITPEASDGNDE